MALVVPSANIEWRITGGINGVTNSNPWLSLGGQMASVLQSDKMDNLWDPASGIERINGRTEYRWIVCWNKGNESIKNPHFYFQPRDPYVELEFSRLAVSAPVGILATEEDRPAEEEIGPEVDSPMPFTKTGESYETTNSIAPDIPAGGKLYICLRRQIPEDSPPEIKALVIVMESRIPTSASNVSLTSGGVAIMEEDN